MARDPYVANGIVTAWGYATYGRLGNGFNNERTRPTPVAMHPQN